MSGYMWYLLIMLVISALVVGAIVQISSGDRIRWRGNQSRRIVRPPEEPVSEKISDWLAEPDKAAKVVIIAWVAAVILGLVWWAYTQPDSPLTRVVLCILGVLFVVVPTILGYLGLFGEVVGGISDLVGWIRGSGSKKR